MRTYNFKSGQVSVTEDSEGGADVFHTEHIFQARRDQIKASKLAKDKQAVGETYIDLKRSAIDILDVQEYERYINVSKFGQIILSLETFMNKVSSIQEKIERYERYREFALNHKKRVGDNE